MLELGLSQKARRLVGQSGFDAWVNHGAAETICTSTAIGDFRIVKRAPQVGHEATI